MKKTVEELKEQFAPGKYLSAQDFADIFDSIKIRVDHRKACRIFLFSDKPVVPFFIKADGFAGSNNLQGIRVFLEGKIFCCIACTKCQLNNTNSQQQHISNYQN